MTRLLVVDDEATAAAGLCTLLELEGYEVTAVVSPQRALELLQSERFDAVITDLEMPIVNGIDIVRAARAARTDMPVFVVTGYGGSHAAAAALELGARAVIEKPLDFDKLDLELRATLSISRP